MFHRHHWAETRRTYTPPPSTLKSWKAEGWQDLEFMQQMIFGLTNVEYSCDCGESRIDTVPGKAE